jgi:hypothetical protein
LNSDEFKLEGLHKKLAVVTWSLEAMAIFTSRQRGKTTIPLLRWLIAGTLEYILT